MVMHTTYVVTVGQILARYPNYYNDTVVDIVTFNNNNNYYNLHVSLWYKLTLYNIVFLLIIVPNSQSCIVVITNCTNCSVAPINYNNVCPLNNVTAHYRTWCSKLYNKAEVSSQKHKVG